MLQTLICCVTLASGAFTQEPTPLQCPVEPEPAQVTQAMVDYAGVRYAFCCGGCVTPFNKEPGKFVAAAAKDQRVVGVSLFDPVSGLRINAKKAEGGWLDSKGTRYYFESQANRQTFEAKPDQFNKVPEKMALYCPVMNHAVKSYAEAGAFADYNGVRYFMCCADCLAPFKAEPTKYFKNAAKAVMAPKPMPAPRVTKGA